MKKFQNTFIVWALLLVACGGNQTKEQESQEQKLYDEVIAVHDQVMPEMSRIMSLQGQLKKAIEELDTTIVEDQQKIMEIEAQILELQEADEAMMQWMRGFEANQEGWPHDSIMSYLYSEKGNIEDVQVKMTQAISNAEELLVKPE